MRIEKVRQFKWKSQMILPSNGKEENEFWPKVHSPSVKTNKVYINSLNQANRWPIQDVGVLSEQ